MTSVFDLLDNPSADSIRAVRDDIAAMDGDIRRSMDAGLAPDEMQKAQAIRSAVQAAAVILEKLFK